MKLMATVSHPYVLVNSVFKTSKSFWPTRAGHVLVLQLLKEVETTLSMQYPHMVHVGLNLTKAVMSFVKLSPDIDSVENLGRLVRRNEYRWLWSIKAPSDKPLWRNRIRQLIESKH